MKPSRARSSALVVVVADDLTGAADTAVHFVRPGGEVLVRSLAWAETPAEPGLAVMAIDTGTRGSSPTDAALSVRRAAGLIRRLAPALVYKKIDSQLRGLPGLEIEILRRELGLRCAFIAPAHPDQGRVTHEGIHFVHGVPVADAEAGRDPVAPVTVSRLPELIAEQSGVRTAHIPRADLEHGLLTLGRKIESLIAAGNLAITFDAASTSHLEIIAEVGASQFPDTLLAGSAGLAAAIAGRRYTGSPAGSVPLPECGSMLFVCGSSARALGRQAALLVDGERVRGLTIAPLDLMDERGRRALALAAGYQWDRSDLILTISQDRSAVAKYPPSSILAGLVAVAMTLIERKRPGGLLLAGGDTSVAVLSAAHVTAVKLRAEAMPGMVWGIAAGGSLEGAMVVMKSGAFGNDGDLVELHRRCRGALQSERA